MARVRISTAEVEVGDRVARTSTGRLRRVIHVDAPASYNPRDTYYLMFEGDESFTATARSSWYREEE